LEVVGSGAFGIVFRAVNKNDNKEYAVKRIQLKGNIDYYQIKVNEEIKSLVQLRNCAQIVGYHEVWYESVKIEFQVSFL
jgi:serine/threonine protein kinase